MIVVADVDECRQRPFCDKHNCVFVEDWCVCVWCSQSSHWRAYMVRREFMLEFVFSSSFPPYMFVSHQTYPCSVRNLDAAHGGIGIYVDAPGYTQNRLVACYLDFNRFVVRIRRGFDQFDWFTNGLSLILVLTLM